ncbi:MAG: acyltransferase [Halieaceae bacterium]|jgi:peptidoglycan/LPS O-acetylase OafA/YrhL|nr:acyltransferase [Halieaceae bacterium]
MSRSLDLTSGIRSSSTYIFELECIRGLAIALVFLFHCYGISVVSPPPGHSPAMSFIVSGNTGVTLFFVLSGFLLGQPWLRSFIDSTVPPPHLWSFYAARGLRVIPLYYAAVAFSVLMSGNWLAGLQAMLFGFVGFDIFPYSVVWWTLSTEVQFYLLLPLTFLLWLSGKPGKILLLAILGLWLYFYVSRVAMNPLPDRNLSYLLAKSIFGRLPAFLAGLLAGYVYLVSKQWLALRENTLPVRLGGIAITSSAVILLAVVLKRAADMGDRTAEQIWHIHHTYEAVLWAVLILSLLLCKLPGKQLLVNRPMAITGKLSYSIYLNHVPILFYMIYASRESMGVENYQASIWFYLMPALGFAASLGMAYVSYRLIELPFLQVKRKLPR